jgi:acetylglutamate/LysW-gamma-L-alpha-aminoadipate kinase
MVMAGKLNKEIVSRLQRYGAGAVGISGADGGFLRAERKKKIVIMDERGRARAIPGGYTGRIIEVNAGVAEKFLNSFQVLVVAPIALGTEHELLNVDADQAAARISMGIRAEKLLVLTDVEGVVVDGNVLGSISANEAEKLQPRIGAGMNRKVMMCCEAVKFGVGEAIISTGLTEDPLEALELEIGTRIRA